MKTKDYLSLGEVSAYLGWSTRFVEGLVRGEKLPGLNINGEWRFRREEIIDWLDQKIQTLDAPRISELERQLEADLVSDGVFIAQKPHRLSSQLSLESIGLDQSHSSKRAVLERLVELANYSGRLLDKDHLFASLLERESLHSTALPNGIAICHPRRPLPSAISDYVIAIHRAATPVPFGSEDGESTHLFFLLCAPDDRTHLHGLARLARILDPATIEALKSRETFYPEQVIEIIKEREATL
ncbi:MAG: PTS sugar transporter subunit IIA [Opitutales bacterium]|nr:PTS sugar transporter subunit IIA [Opitutales bacterium]